MARPHPQPEFPIRSSRVRKEWRWARPRSRPGPNTNIKTLLSPPGSPGQGNWRLPRYIPTGPRVEQMRETPRYSSRLEEGGVYLLKPRVDAQRRHQPDIAPSEPGGVLYVLSSSTTKGETVLDPLNGVRVLFHNG